MERIYINLLKHHFSSYEKMAFLSGARQVGKTTISEMSAALGWSMTCYLNWDNLDHQTLILQGPEAIALYFQLNVLAEQKKILIFDELHKYTHWRNFLKGFYDSYKSFVQIIVTGSAQLDVFRYGGDSLMGRYFSYHIDPLSVRECIDIAIPASEISLPQKIHDEDWDALLKFGGFPEPFSQKNKLFFNKWQRLREEQLFEKDIRSITRIREIAQMRMLSRLIRSQTGQLINYSELAKQVHVSSETVMSWIETLNAFYYCFTIKPWYQNISRSLVKQPKIYLYDWSMIQDIGARCENFIACHLLKAMHFWTDMGFGQYGLYFLRDKEQREVDFLITKDETPWILVEAKNGDSGRLSKNLGYFQEKTKALHAFQVSLSMEFLNKNCFDFSVPIIVPAKTFLSQLI